MKPISEETARRILREVRSQAASPEKFRAERLAGGWAFRWADKSMKTPFGARTWVVTDSGSADMVDLGENAAAALVRLTTL